MLFSRNRSTPADTAPPPNAPAPSPAPAHRLVVEQASGFTVSGWAADPAGQPLQTLTLWQGPRRWDLATEWCERLDVSRSLGVPEGGLLGFSAELPAEVWQGSDAAASPLVLQAGDARCELPALPPLAQLLSHWQAQPEGRARTLALRQAVMAVAQAGGPTRLPQDLATWLQAQAQRHGWAAALGQPGLVPPVPAPVRAVLESSTGLVWSGWAWAGDATEEHLSLSGPQGQALVASTVRLERADVQQATGAARLLLGFELELPSLIWPLADDQGEVALSLGVEGESLTPQPVRVSHAHLRAELDALRAAPAPDPATPGASHEQQYRWLLLLEHLAAAGLMGRLNAEQAEAVSRQAERFNLHSLLPGEAEGRPGPTVPQHALGTVQVWRLLRLYNERLPDDVQAETASALLRQLLAEHQVDGELRHRLVLAVAPFFCGLGAYDVLRPWLDVQKLKAMARANSAWELSLAVLEPLASADLAEAARVLRRLHEAPAGWLNTECIAEAVRSLHRVWPGDAKALPEALAVVKALLALLDQQAASYWGRSQDRQLIDAELSLLALAPELPTPMARAVEQAVQRHHAFSPGFWSQLRARWPDRRDWPLSLQDALPRFDHVQQVLQGASNASAAALAALAPWLAPALALGNLDAALILRETLLATAALGQAPPAAAAALAALAPAEPLRLAAHPLAAPVSEEQADRLADHLRACSGVPHPPARARLLRTLAALRPAPGAGAALVPLDHDTLRHLAQAAHHHVGVRLATAGWLLQHERLDPAAAGRLLALVHDTWRAAFDASVGQPAPSAALISSWSLLEGWRRQQAHPAADAVRVIDSLRAALIGRHGSSVLAALPPTGDLQLRASDPALSTLVAIYSCRRNLDSRVRLIRDTWARDLTARGIPWVVVVGDGDGQLQGDVLALPVSDAYEALPAKTLALARWVRQHTDFQHLLKIDDDCHLAVARYFEASAHLAQHYLGRRLHRAEGGTDRRWHQAKAAGALGASALDKSPEPSVYADGGAGYALSRWALARLEQVLATRSGARLTRSAYMEDKLVGDLLAWGDIRLSSLGHETLVRRRFGPGAVPVNAFQNLFYPSRSSPTVISHLDDAQPLPQVQQGQAGTALQPGRLWPSDAPPVLGGVAGTNQLELLSAPAGVAALAAAPLLVVAVARNERLLMPHFLAHYRGLGVRHFVLVDNLSDDGTREYLLAQPDVVLYSADTEYRHSHYGVAWQQAVLAAHALGKWVVLADIDEFLVFPGCEHTPLPEWLARQGERGADAVLTLMVDMYPAGDLAQARFDQAAPFEVARQFDRQPLLRWRLGSGCFSNGPTYLSALRHRLIPDSAPNLYTSQKLAVFRHQPWVRLSEGLHYAANLHPAAEPACFAHFKYHAGFRAKVLQEVARKQHFNGAEEYAKYLSMVAEAQAPLADARWSASAETPADVARQTLASLDAPAATPAAS